MVRRYLDGEVEPRSLWEMVQGRIARMVGRINRSFGDCIVGQEVEEAENLAFERWLMKIDRWKDPGAVLSYLCRQAVRETFRGHHPPKPHETIATRLPGTATSPSSRMGRKEKEEATTFLLSDLWAFFRRDVEYQGRWLELALLDCEMDGRVAHEIFAQAGAQRLGTAQSTRDLRKKLYRTLRRLERELREQGHPALKTLGVPDADAGEAEEATSILEALRHRDAIQASWVVAAPACRRPEAVVTAAYREEAALQERIHEEHLGCNSCRPGRRPAGPQGGTG